MGKKRAGEARKSSGVPRKQTEHTEHNVVVFFHAAGIRRDAAADLPRSVVVRKAHEKFQHSFRLAFGIRCFDDLGFGSLESFLLSHGFLRVKLLIRRAVPRCRVGNVLEAHLLQS